MINKFSFKRRHVYFGIYINNKQIFLIKEKEGILAVLPSAPASDSSMQIKSFLKGIYSPFHISHLIIPSNLFPEPVYQKNFEEVCFQFGIHFVHFIEPLLLAGIGAELNCKDDIFFIGNFENGVAEIGLIAFNKLLYSQKIPYESILNLAIIHYIVNNHKIIIEQNTAEKIWQKIGTFDDLRLQVTVAGYKLTGEEQTTLVTSEEISPILKDIFVLVINECKTQIELIPFILNKSAYYLLKTDTFNNKKISEFYCKSREAIKEEILQKGLFLTGQGSNIYELDNFMSNKLNIQVQCVKEPEHCINKGLQFIMTNQNLLTVK